MFCLDVVLWRRRRLWRVRDDDRHSSQYVSSREREQEKRIRSPRWINDLHSRFIVQRKWNIFLLQFFITYFAMCGVCVCLYAICGMSGMSSASSSPCEFMSIFFFIRLYFISVFGGASAHTQKWRWWCRIVFSVVIYCLSHLFIFVFSANNSAFVRTNSIWCFA